MDVEYAALNKRQGMANTSVLLKLKVVLWKNFIIRKHHWFLTLCEIAIPIVLFILIAYARSKIDGMGKTYITTPTYTDEHSTEEFYNNKLNHETRIFYTPQNEFTEALIRRVQLKFTFNSEAIKGFDTEQNLVAYYEAFAHNLTVMAVVFKGAQGRETPKHLDYVIRPFEKYVNWETRALFNSIPQYIPDYGSSYYINKGFIAVQMALDISFIEMTSNKDLPVTLVMQEFPYPPYLNDAGAADMFLYILPLITIFSFVFLCPAVLKRVVEEKSTGIKELMKMMGLKSWMLWLGWFLHAFIANCVSIFIITFFMKVTLWGAQFPPIEYCSASLLMVFLILYCAAGITFCFAISSLFNRPTLAMVVGIFAWILSYSIPAGLLEQSPDMTWITKISFSLFPNMALTFGYQAISVYETREVGAHWGNLFKSASGGHEDVTMGNVLLMFIVDIILYMLITLYIENIKPGPYGLAKPFHFPVSFIYNKILKRSARVEDDEESTSKEYCKIEPATNLNAGIEIKNLHKKFGKQAAVNGLSIDIYEGQITALLGHNGAGKTTTMSIITGMIGATSGKVLINKEDIRYNMNKVRSSLGLCPQQNLQFTDLTVLEHLAFFAMLKGLSRSQATVEAENLLRRMNLFAKRHSLASSLSGGMRRKLSLGIALIGNAKVLILDEPTSGLDPEARREIWDMLLTLRGSRTIVITTHFMEEADVLGDRIAIMDHGRLICYGTSMFLKNEYGTGYHLTIIRDEVAFNTSKKNHLKTQTEEITHVIREKIGTAVLQANTANHLTYLLPHETKPCFSDLLAELEDKKDELGITNISMSVTTLEEVFLRVGNMVTKEDAKEKANNRKSAGHQSIGSTNTVESTSSTSSTTSTKSTGNELIKLQLLCLFKKRVSVTWKKKIGFMIMVLIALSTTMLTLYLGEAATSSGTENFDTLNFDLSKYGETSVFYGGTGSDPNLAEMEEYYNKLVATQRGDPHKAPSVSDAIIKEGEKNIAFYKQHMIVSAEFNVSDSGEKIVNAMYSNRALHGAPISLNLVMNAVLKGIMGDGFSISTANFPLPIAAGNSLEEASEMQVAILWFIWFPLGMLFLSGTFLLFPHMERVSNIKQLQIMCGVRSVYYWLTSYVFDLMLYFGAMFVILIFVWIYGMLFSGTFSGQHEIGALLVILVAYGISIIPYAYLFSYKKTAAAAFASFLIGSMFLSVVLTIIVLILEWSIDEYYINLGKNIKYALLLFPQFGLTYTSVQFSMKAVWNHNWDIKPEEHKQAKCRFDYNPCCDGTSTPECIKYRSYFCGDKSITVNVIEMAASVTIYFALLLLLETNFVHRFWNRFLVFVYNKIHRKEDVTDSRDKDKVDVSNEMERVSATLKREKNPGGEETGCLDPTINENENDLLLVHKLEKIYWGQKAVKGVSFGVKPGDCFGLLGVNGAGKTTTFKMLTGDEPVLTGDARILASSKDTAYISKDTKKYLEKVGYCPQFDAINEVLTGREMLTLFAELRGISVGVEEEVNKWLSALGLEEYADKPCGEYSGGNKRKLSMAVALIGNPLLVMLDEPTSGVDPVSRRKLWDTLTAIQRHEVKPSILLTSHSMEECEALCNKLAIMKAGELECYGTIPKLKQKYGQGFTVMLKLKPTLLTISIDPANIEDDQSTTSQSRPLSMPANQNDPASKKKGQSMQPGVVEDPEVKQLQEDFEKQYGRFCTLRDKHSGLLHYHISDKNKRWSELFKEIETLKQAHPVIEDYNISETTLEEVFLSIARS